MSNRDIELEKNINQWAKDIVNTRIDMKKELRRQFIEIAKAELKGRRDKEKEMLNEFIEHLNRLRDINIIELGIELEIHKIIMEFQERKEKLVYL